MKRHITFTQRTHRNERMVYSKEKDLATWNSLYFASTSTDPPIRMNHHSNEDLSMDQLPTSESTVEFTENFNRKSLKHISQVRNKALRNRLANLMSHIEAVAQHESVSPKMISMYLVRLYSLDDYDISTANVTKELIQTGKFGQTHNKLSLDSSAFLFDSLEIGKSKYIDLRRILLSESFNLPGYNCVALHRRQISLVDEMHFVERDYPIGIGISYHKLLTHTINRIILNISIPDFKLPLKVRISDGLDGSGSHRIYQQAAPHPDITTKNFLLFAFKVLTISDKNNDLIWTNSVPNSPFSIRPVTILALPENQENVSFLMKTSINTETTDMEVNGLELIRGIHASVDIIRSQIDGKMAKILSGAGGASCQFCTATFKQIHDVDIVKEGFPINRFISDAKVLFEEVDEEEFLSLNTDERFQLTHVPASDKDIVASSPLHAYLRCFGWFMNLVSHLNAGVNKWSPTSFKVQSAKSFICGLVRERLSIMIDFANSQGGTSTTGNVTRRCFLRTDDNDKDFLYWVLSTIPADYKEVVTEIHTYLGAILRVYNSGRQIDTEELSGVCRKIYLLVLNTFPWVNISPTLHKVLAHSSDIISTLNNGLGLEMLSEEGLESSNKLIRRYRELLSRKFNFNDNIKDVFTRMICQSDPLLLLNRSQKKSVSYVSKVAIDRSKQESLVNSLILIEDD